MGFAVEESGIIGQAERPISTGKLNALQRLHRRPINQVVYLDPSAVLRRRENLSWEELGA